MFNETQLNGQTSEDNTDTLSVAIIDFGISSFREDGSTIVVTRTGMTPEYSRLKPLGVCF